MKNTNSVLSDKLLEVYKCYLRSTQRVEASGNGGVISRREKNIIRITLKLYHYFHLILKKKLSLHVIETSYIRIEIIVKKS